MSILTILMIAAIPVVFFILIRGKARIGRSWPARVSAAAKQAGFTTFRVFVMSRQVVSIPGVLNGWVQWSPNLGGGPTLLVRPGSFEVVAPQGMVLEPRHLAVRSFEAEMWLDRVGLLRRGRFGIGGRECVHVAARDQDGHRIQLALAPRGYPRSDLWDALLACGVRQRQP